MRRPSLSLLVAAGALCAVSLSTAAHAQRGSNIEIRTRGDGSVECRRDGRRVDCESLRAERERAERERERALERSREARDRALELQRRERERAQERSRLERERVIQQQRAEAARRQADARRRQNDWAETLRRDLARDLERDRLRTQLRRARDDTRPRVSLGGGADIRRFDAVNRYVANLGVDFRSRSGLGMRPEVVFGWTDRQREQLPTIVCPSCVSFPGSLALNQTVELRSRSKMLGVNLDATYMMLRGSSVRPYLLGGVGVLSTREVVPVVATAAPLSSIQGAQAITYRTESHNRVNLGLNAGAGMEFGRGPVRVFTEFRYFLHDAPSARGFSGMLPITAGIRF